MLEEGFVGVRKGVVLLERREKDVALVGVEDSSEEAKSRGFTGASDTEDESRSPSTELVLAKRYLRTEVGLQLYDGLLEVERFLYFLGVLFRALCFGKRGIGCNTASVESVSIVFSLL